VADTRVQGKLHNVTVSSGRERELLKPVSPPLTEADDEEEEEEEEVLDEEAQLMASMGLPVAFLCSSDRRRAVSGSRLPVTSRPSTFYEMKVTPRGPGALPAADPACLWSCDRGGGATGSPPRPSQPKRRKTMSRRTTRVRVPIRAGQRPSIP